MFKTKINGFTLVELIVVITILAILGTIAFISLQGYSKSSRDSVRITDVSNMKTSLELFHLNAGKYPLPDDYETVSYNLEDLWYQGTFGSTVVSQLSRNISEIPSDPLLEKKYIFSIANNKNEFEVLTLLEGDIVMSSITETNAATVSVTPRINGNYNGVFIKTAKNIVPIPSIITSEDITGGLILGTANIDSQVVSGGDNIPNIGNVNSATGQLTGLDFVPVGVVTKDSTSAEKAAVVLAIQDAYDDTESLKDEDIYAYILNVSGETNLANLLDSVVFGDSTTPPVTSSFDIYNVNITSDSDKQSMIDNLFGSSSSKYTSNWGTNSCSTDQTNYTFVEATTPGDFVSNQDNTIYILKSNITFISSNISLGNCNVILGDYTLTNNVLSGGSTGLISLDGKTNVIIDNITIVGNKPSLTYYPHGINVNNSHNTTIDSVIVHDADDGLRITGASTYTIVLNSTFYSNNDEGIQLGDSGDNCQNNILNDITIYNNGQDGIFVWDSSNNDLTNITAYTNGRDGIRIAGDNNNLNIATSHNNFDHGTYILNGNLATLNNITSYDNSGSGIRFESMTNSSINNSDIYSNNNNGIHMKYGNDNTIQDVIAHGNNRAGFKIEDTDSNTFDNIKSYLNTDHGIKLVTGADNNILKNSLSYGNITDGNDSGGLIIRENSNNNTINNVKLYGNAQIGLQIDDNSDYNTINNTLVYNNSDHGIRIDGGGNCDYNSINNTISFNNSGAGYKARHGYNTAINNFYSWNNGGSGMEFVDGNDNFLLNNVYVFDNVNNGIDTNNAYNYYLYGSVLVSNNGGTVSYDNTPIYSDNSNNGIGWTGLAGGGISIAATDTTWHITPNVSSWNLTTRGDAGLSYSDSVSYIYGSTIANQKQPVSYSTSTQVLELNTTATFNTSLQIGK